MVEDEPLPAMFGGAADPEAEAAPAPPPTREPPEEAPRRPRPMRPPPAPPKRRGAGLAWTVLILLLVVIVGGGWAFRDEVVQAWPDARRIYALTGIGVEAPGSGLELRNVTWKRDQQDGATMLLVEGDVANVSKEVRAVPRIRGALVGGGREVQHWEFSPSQAKLLPGESVHFTTELRNPAPGAERLTMNFSDAP